MILLAIWWLKRRPTAPRLPLYLYRASGAFAGLWGVHAAWILWLNEYPLLETLDGYRHYLELLLFIPMSVALYHLRSRLLVLLWVPVIAVVVRILHRTDYTDLGATLFSAGSFGFGTYYVTFGMQVMIASLTCASLALVTWPRLMPRSRVWFAVLGLAVFALLLQAMLTSGSRSAWGCFMAGMITFAWLARYRLLQVMRSAVAKCVAGALCIALALIVFGSLEKIEERWSARGELSLQMWSLDALDRERDIFPDRRIFLAVYGVERWLERPWLGHGPASVTPLLDEDETLARHPHLHNTYVQLLTEGGLLGACAFYLLLGALVMGAVRRTDARTAPLRWWLAAMLVAVALWSVVNFHLHNSDWRFTWVWCASIAAVLMREYNGSGRDSEAVPPVR